jgi:protein-serine/threonine kinase
MLAGYLPFDDDPANPDGDNINLLYKYIVTTPLTFPEYVTPHARDLLRRILVPDPRKRADLFEVARHSWLSEYSHVVSHITSSTTNVADIANTTVNSGEFNPFEPLNWELTIVETQKEAPHLARSASVREPPKTSQSNVPAVGGLNHHAGDISQDSPSEKSKTTRDAKRRTVQVEYVAPQSQTTRGEPPAEPSTSRRAPAPSELPVAPVQQPAEPVQKKGADAPALNLNKPLPGYFPRSTSDNAALTGSQHVALPSGARPATGGSMASFNNAGRLPSRGSYGQPVAPTVTATNTEGRLAQPKSRQFTLPQESEASNTSIGRPSTQVLPSTFNTTPRQEPPKGHKRSNTVSSLGEKLFGRSGSIMGGRGSQANTARTKQDKRYPPVSMKEPLPRENSRISMDSRRSMQYPHNRKASESGLENRPRRFSLLPQSFSFRGFSTGRAQTPDEQPEISRPLESRGQQRPATGPAGPGEGRARSTSYGAQDAMGMVREGPAEDIQVENEPLSYEAQIDRQFADLGTQFDQPHDSFGMPSAEQVYQNSRDQYSGNNYGYQAKPNYYDDYNGTYDSLPRQSMQAGRSNRGPNVLQKNHRKFADAYEYERDGSHHSGSSGAARKVMDFFRRRAKSRAGDER